MYETGPDGRFLHIDNGHGVLLRESSIDIDLLFNSFGLVDGSEYELALLIANNSIDNEKLVPISFTVDSASSVDDSERLHPVEFALETAYPNPFNSLTRISFSLKESQFAQLEVFDIYGRLIEVLVSVELPAGGHTAILDAGNLASGIYFYRLIAGDKQAVQRMVLLR